jgi:hypothetical protein
MSLSTIFREEMGSNSKIWGIVENLRCFLSYQVGQRSVSASRGNRIYLPSSLLEYTEVEHEPIHLEIVNPNRPNRYQYAGNSFLFHF